MRGHMSVLWHALRHGSQRRRRRSAGCSAGWTVGQTEALESRILLSATVGDAKVDVPAAALAQASTAYLPVGVSLAEFAATLTPTVDAKPSGIPPALNALIPVGETEPNDDFATANPVPLGFGAGEDVAVDVSGVLTPPPAPTPFANAEDDGSITLANPTGLTSGSVVTTSAEIGDGPFGATSGDYDHYSITGVAAGDLIFVDINADVLGSTLDSFVGIYDSTGTLLGTSDDDGATFDSFLTFIAPAAGDYSVVVRGFGFGFQVDPFDSSSGSGVGETGTYDVIIGWNAGDRDVFAVDLEAGDILGANLTGATGLVSLFDSGGSLLVGSGQDASFIYPLVSPLPGGGTAALAWVVDTPGTYYVATTGGVGAYDLELRLFRPVLEAEPVGTEQILFLDFDGAIIDPSIFGGPAGPVALSPLSSFLAGWGLTPGDESAVIDAIVASVTENFADIGLIGLNGDYDTSLSPGDYGIEILNSRDHADPFGDPNVSRVIIGGTIGELGIGTIGIAQSIDVGNFETSESAVTLLDLLSAPAADPNSLNQYAIDPGSSIIDLIGVGVGNITAHEAGHFFANFHTDQFNPLANIMDQGGNLDNTVGVGPDLIFGTGDDVDNDFGKDTFVPDEGFIGTEDTLNSIAFGLSTGTVMIIDNGDAGFSTVGIWTAKANLLARDADVHHSAAGTGSNLARWEFTGLTPGNYRVSATWLEHANRATDSPFTAFDAVGGGVLNSRKINQELAPDDFTADGSDWEDLFVVSVTGSTLVIELANAANQFVIADAIRLEPTAAAASAAIIDDGLAAYAPGFATVGTWTPSPTNFGRDSDLRHNFAGTGLDTATWTFSGLTPGDYAVSATWFAHANRATDAPYTILDGAVPLATVDVNQELAPDDFTEAGSAWENLLTVTITGTALSVQLSDDADQFVIADAIRIVSV